MEADKEIHSQALGWALGVLLKKGRRDYESWGSWQRQLTWICGSPWTLDPHLGSLEWIDLGSLNVCDSNVDWFLCKAPSTEIRVCLYLAVSWLLGTCFHAGLPYPALTQEEEHDPSSIWCATLCESPWEDCSMEEHGGWGKKEERREGKLRLVCKIKFKMLSK